MNKLVKLNNDKTTIFVGDIHGDLATLNRVIEKYPPTVNRLVFLGDYIDRGEHSVKCVLNLIFLQERNPDDVILLMGNHEADAHYSCSDFFTKELPQNVSIDTSIFITRLLSDLPLVVALGKDIIACHGIVPFVDSLDEINNIHPKSNQFIQATWGDYVDTNEVYGISDNRIDRIIRTKYNNVYLDKVLGNINRKILIRGHQQSSPAIQHEGKIITLMTTDLYIPYYGKPKVAVVYADSEIPIIKEV